MGKTACDCGRTTQRTRHPRLDRGQVFLSLESQHRPIMESPIDEHITLPRLLILHGDRTARVVAESDELVIMQLARSIFRRAGSI